MIYRKKLRHHLWSNRLTRPTSKILSASKGAISLLIDAAPDWYTLKKRAVYLTAFTHYIKQKTRKEPFEKLKLNVNYLNKAMLRVVEYVQRVCFGAATKKLSEGLPESLEDVVSKLACHATNDTEKKESCRAAIFALSETMCIS